MINPYRLIQLNRIRLKFTNNAIWKIRNKWYNFKDMKGSNTPEIVYNELIRGVYSLPPLVDGDVVIDLGAHIGMFCIPLAKDYPNIKIIAVEPNPTNYRNLRRNIRKSEVTNIIPVYSGIWDKPDIGLESVYPLGNSGGSHTSENNSSVVRSMTWKQIIATALHYSTNKRIALLKCDIEGAEFKTFKSKSDFNLVDCIRIEIHGSLKDCNKMCLLVHESVNDYIIQRLHGDNVKSLEKNDFSRPARNKYLLDGRFDELMIPYVDES